LLKLLTGETVPDAGELRLGANIVPAVFDQNRAALDPDVTLWESLTGDKAMRVAGKADQVMVRGQPRHVVAYLKDFLFDERQARAPVRALSGGERARLLLARIMARESNLLILDEPTNDLDIETLDLLEDLLGSFAGTVLLVSHDRDFIDRVATATVAAEGDGRWTVFAGGWSDMQAQKGPARPAPAKPGPVAPGPPARTPKPKPSAPAKTGLTFTEAHRLRELPGEIARLEAEIARLSELLADAELFARAPEKAARATEALAERQARLSAAEEDWLTLAEKAESGL